MNKTLLYVVIILIPGLALSQLTYKSFVFDPANLIDTVVQQVTLTFEENGKSITEIHRFYFEGLPEQTIYKSEGKVDSIRVFSTYGTRYKEVPVRRESDTNLIFGSEDGSPGISTVYKPYEVVLKDGELLAQSYHYRDSGIIVLHSYLYYSEIPKLGIVRTGERNEYTTHTDSTFYQRDDEYSVLTKRINYFEKDNGNSAWEQKKCARYFYDHGNELVRFEEAYQRDSLLLKSFIKIIEDSAYTFGRAEIRLIEDDIDNLRHYCSESKNMLPHGPIYSGGIRLEYVQGTSIPKYYYFSDILSFDWESISLSDFSGKNWRKATLISKERKVVITRSF